MKKSIIFSFLCISLFVLQAQMPRMKIVNSGDLMSTFGLEEKESEKKEVLAQVGEAALQDILKYSEESGWPSGIYSLDARNKNRPLIADYVAYKVATFGNDGYNVILCIPPSKNTFQPEDMQAAHNIYFIIGKNGVSEVADDFFTFNIPNATAQNQEANNSQSPNDFASQMNVLLEGLHNNFSDLKGEEIKEDMLLGNKYQCKVQLEGAEETYIFRGIASYPSLIATFGDYRDEAEAVKQYLALAEAVNETPFPCCTLVRNTDDNETLRTNYWLPFDLSGKMHPNMKDMVMEVQMMKTLGIDTNTFKTYDNYSIVLRIYHQK